jgi:hypothetical protein
VPARWTRRPRRLAVARSGVLDDGSYYVPDYQRDSSQWDLAKKSLFIDSLINNLTIPPLIVYPETDKGGAEKHQIVDGQQRLTTIRDYLKGAFALAPETDVEYADNVAPIIQGKTFGELPDAIQKQIKRYVVNIIILPKDLELSLRLEIFRRINEAGVPLSPHDLRLAVFGQSDRVYLIRLAGVFDEDREGARRMVAAAKERYSLEYPWKNASAWAKWWQAESVVLGLRAVVQRHQVSEGPGNRNKLSHKDRPLFIAAAVGVWGTPETLTEKQWELVQVFLTQGPTKIEAAVGISYPITKGKWPGQRTQIEKTGDVCLAIAKK